MLSDAIRHALATERTIDITTTGRFSGQPRRIELWFHNLDGQLYFTGRPGRRDWYANLLAEPHFTFHLKQSVHADLPARATPVTDEGERRRLLRLLASGAPSAAEFEDWVQRSPLMQVEILDE